MTLQLMIHLTVQSGGAPMDSLKDLQKDAQEDAFEVAIKGEFEDALEFAPVFGFVDSLIGVQKSEKKIIK